MNEESIIDYHRQKHVNRLYVILVIIILFIASVLLFLNPTNLEIFLLVYFALPIGLLFFSTLFGALSKRAIDYKPGEWTKEKVWVSFEEYEEMVEKYEESYGHLYARRGEGCSLLGMIIITILLGVVILVYQEIAHPIFSSLIDGLLFLIISYLVTSIAGFVIGFRYPKIDAMEFFKAPVKGDVTNFARELEDVPGLRVGLDVELGTRAGVRTILEAEVKTYIEGLPETAQIRVQVSHSGFAYPYLVGTLYKGQPVKEQTEKVRLRTKYTPIFEYSMDEDVVVIVARFDIPSRTSSVPSISNKDFRALAAALVHVMNENYEKTQ
jgi:uncharacterized membrane protein